ncbi:MAG: hypothetical protein U0X20_23695 [Caldilineaceae bacterium]
MNNQQQDNRRVRGVYELPEGGQAITRLERPEDPFAPRVVWTIRPEDWDFEKGQPKAKNQQQQ